MANPINERAKAMEEATLSRIAAIDTAMAGLESAAQKMPYDATAAGAATMSIAISLKRIADRLDKGMPPMQCDHEMVDAGEIGPAGMRYAVCRKCGWGRL